MQGIYASRSAQSIWSEEKSTIPFLFFISFCPWNVFFPAELSHLPRAVLVCVVTITGRSALDGLKLIWIKTRSVGGGGGENKEVFVIYGETKRGGKKAWPRREGSLSLFCMHGGFCGRRSWQGAAVLPPALRQQLLRKKRRPEGAATCLALSPSLFFTCLPLPFTEQTHARHMCNTPPSPHSHASPQWHTHTHACTHTPGACGLWDS